MIRDCTSPHHNKSANANLESPKHRTAISLHWTFSACILTALLLAVRANAAESVPELVGIRIGMSAAEATTVLQQRQLNVQTLQASFPHSTEQPFPTILKAYPGTQGESNSRENLQVYLATPPSEARVVSLWRLITYSAGAGPLPETIVEAMVKKFGEPVKKSHISRQTHLLWLWNAEGTPVQPKNGLCETYLTALNYQGGMSGGPFTNSITPDKFAKPVAAGCAAGVQAIIETSSMGPGVTRYVAVAADFQEADRVIKLTAEQMAQLGAEADKKARAAAGAVKPDI